MSLLPIRSPTKRQAQNVAVSTTKSFCLVSRTTPASLSGRRKSNRAPAETSAFFLAGEGLTRISLAGC